VHNDKIKCDHHNGVYVFDGIGEANQHECVFAQGLVCEFTADCPIKVKEKPEAAPARSGRDLKARVANLGNGRSLDRTIAP